MKRWLAMALVIMVTAGLALPLGGCYARIEVIPTPAPVDLGEILGRAAGIASLKYDMVVSLPSSPEALTVKLWEKGNKVRMAVTEGGQEVVWILDPDQQRANLWFPAQNMATSGRWGPEQSVALFAAPATAFSRELADQAKAAQAKVAGTETLEGKDCLVVYSPEGLPGTPSFTAWIWMDWGLPLRVQFLPDAYPIAIEFKNIEFADIPDSVFELPPGVQITEW